jgi:AcrR family transcriptional regulator
VRVFARRGVASAAITDVTTEANVSNGTFYYHFKDKEELVNVVGHEIAAQLVAEVDISMSDIASGIERVALGTQSFLRLAAADPEWGNLVVAALFDMRDFHERISMGIRKDVSIGIRQGAFDIPVNEILISAMLTVVATGLKAILSGGRARAIEAQTSEMVLRLLGLDIAEARRVVQAVKPLLRQPRPIDRLHLAAGSAGKARSTEAG